MSVSLVTFFILFAGDFFAFGENECVFQNAVSFGKETKQTHWPLMHSDLIQLNHGAYGATPNCAIEAATRYRNMMENDPTSWFRFGYMELHVKAREHIAEYINADPKDVVFVENASNGVNAVMRSLDMKAGDKVMVYDFRYPMIRHLNTWLSEFKGVEEIVVELEFPVYSDAQILDPLKEALEMHAPQTKIAVIDHIPSSPSIILPMKEIIDLFHSFGVPVLVDGAHCVGQIPLDMEALGAEYYLANGHKWLYVPKSAAFLYVRPDKQDELVATTISSRGDLDFVQRFEYTGTRDYSAMLAVVDALDFRSSMGEQNITRWNNGLMRWAEDFLVDLWGTERVDYRPNGQEMRFMANVRVPTDDIDIATRAQDIIDAEKCFINIYQNSGKIWVRLGAQIYTDQSDFEYAGRRLLEVIRELEIEKQNLENV